MQFSLRWIAALLCAATAVASSRRLDTWQIQDFGRVDMVSLQIGGLSPAVAGGETTWPQIPAVTNAQSAEVFGSNYPPGVPVDAVSLAYTGPGGAPDLSEHFDLPGATLLAA